MVVAIEEDSLRCVRDRTSQLLLNADLKVLWEEEEQKCVDFQDKGEEETKT